MKKASSRSAVILWAVDPFAASRTLQREAGWAIQAMLSRWDVQVQPVYAVTDPLPNLPDEFIEEVFKGAAEKSKREFELLRRGIKLRSLLPLAIVRAQGRSVSGQVAAVLDYARGVGAEMIVSSTRARKGPARWFFGSFAETLSLRSEVPLFFVNPAWRPKRLFNDILFPTDFSPESHAAFRDVISYALAIGSRIRLFSKFAPEVTFNWDFSLSADHVYRDSARDWAKEELRSLEIRAKKWAKEAQERGAECSWEVQGDERKSLVSSILDASRKYPCLIAMASQSGPLEVDFMGSVTRQVMRGAAVPVMVIHPEPQEKKGRVGLTRFRSASGFSGIFKDAPRSVI